MFSFSYDVYDICFYIYQVGSAFDALAYDGIHAAPLWDDMSRSFVGRSQDLY